MNWMGSVRKRLSASHERKKQQDFFAKRKFEAKVEELHVRKTISESSVENSQDLVTFRMANKGHRLKSPFAARERARKSAKIRKVHVDMDHQFPMIGQRINHVDLDQLKMSPMNKVSTLQLSEHDRNKNWSEISSKSSNAAKSPSTFTHEKEELKQTR